MRAEASLDPGSFSRLRKLSLPNLFLSILHFTRPGIQINIDGLFSFLAVGKEAVTTYTKSAFSQARQKFHPKAFLYFNRQLLDFYGRRAPLQYRWNGLRPVAIDGSSLNLPNTDVLRAHFGETQTQNKPGVVAKVSWAYDICNHLVLDCGIQPYDKGEQAMAKEHLQHLDTASDVLVFDRGYPSHRLASDLTLLGFKYCMRLNSSWTMAAALLGSADDVVYHVPTGTPIMEDGKRSFLETGYTARLVKVILPSGEYEILMTNLTEGFSLADLRELYWMRWCIEECYKRLKAVAQVEFFSGRTVRAIEQDFYARTLMLNVASMIEMQEVQVQLDRKESKKANLHKKQVNRTQVYAKLKTSLYELVLKYSDVLLQKMLTQLGICWDIVRLNRSFPRNKGFKAHRKPLNYKPL